MIKAVIIDDEQACIDDLAYLLNKESLPVEVEATANSGVEGLAAILKHKPQLVFLDVVMPGMSGFEMIELLPKLDFHLIIITSADKYAIQAIRTSALDFLLKPVKPQELKEAVNRSIEKREVPDKSQLNLLRDSLNEKNRPLRKIALSISEGVELVNIDDIYYFESDGNYTTVVMKNEKSILVSKPIGKFEEMTDAMVFFRVHNSYLVNLQRITKYIRGDGGYIVLENGKTISVSRNKREAFLEMLSKI